MVLTMAVRTSDEVSDLVCVGALHRGHFCLALGSCFLFLSSLSVSSSIMREMHSLQKPCRHSRRTGSRRTSKQITQHSSCAADFNSTCTEADEGTMGNMGAGRSAVAFFRVKRGGLRTASNCRGCCIILSTYPKRLFSNDRLLSSFPPLNKQRATGPCGCIFTPKGESENECNNQRLAIYAVQHRRVEI